MIFLRCIFCNNELLVCTLSISELLIWVTALITTSFELLNMFKLKSLWIISIYNSGWTISLILLKNKVNEEFGLRWSESSLKMLLVKFGLKISKIEKPKNLLCETNEAFLCKQRARLRRSLFTGVIEKTSKPFRVCLMLKVSWSVLI